MKTVFLVVGLLTVTLMTAGSLYAQGSIVQTVADGCKPEIEIRCKDVSPGEGRILACLFAYQDKLSAKCEWALYDSAVRLERAVAALSYAVNECEADLTAYCADVKAGQGRLLQCIDQNDANVSQRCKDALKTVGLK